MNSFLFFITFHCHDLYEEAISFQATTLYLAFEMPKQELSICDVF